MSEIICTGCGTPMQAGLKFCGACGAKAPEPPPPPPEPVPAPIPDPTPAPAPAPAPLRFLDYLLMVLVFSVPLAGALAASMWAFGWALGKNPKKDRKAFALAQFVVKAAFILAFLAFYFVNFNAMNELIKVIFS